jgi:hypothetical protein
MSMSEFLDADEKQLNRAIELHDSRIESILQVGTQFVVLLRAYVHQSEGHPGFDAGSGWIQAIALIFNAGAKEGIFPDFPADIWDGRLRIGSEQQQSLIPIPFHQAGEAVLELRLENAETIRISGSRMALTLIADAA